jgi:hypothetical protein
MPQLHLVPLRKPDGHFMRYILFVPIALLMSCGGSLSDEQRKKIKEGMESQKIVKISDAEIMSEALKKGQVIFSGLRENLPPNELDSIQRVNKASIHFIKPGENNARAIEQELIDAYVESIALGQAEENLQKLWTDETRTDYDSLLYSRPHLVAHADGSEELRGIWNIYIARKDIILQFSRKK